MPKLLSIAINDYPKTNRKLKGAINDSRLWSGWFASRGWEVETLWNQEATSQQILAAIERMMRQAQAGDRLAIHFSGHGTQVVDAGGDEVDSLDECYCPWDVTEKGPIRDDQLFNLFQLRLEGVRLYLFADCCHSGSINRGEEAALLARSDKERQREQFTPQSGAIKIEPVERYLPLRNPVNRKKRQARREPAIARTTGLLMAACGESERAREISLGGMTYGNFTRAAILSLDDLPQIRTPRQWFIAIAAKLRRRHLVQTPQLVGNTQLMDEPLFDL